MTRRRWWRLCASGTSLAGLVAWQAWRHGAAYVVPIRVREVEPGSLYRGAWQQPWPMARLIDSGGIRTVVALANPVAHPYAARERDLVRGMGVRWKHIPIIDDPAQTGGRSMTEQLDEAADWLADPRRRPLYFHCHHGITRTSMVQMAWRAKHCGWTLDRAAEEVSRLVGPEAVPKGEDMRRVERFVAERVSRVASSPAPARRAVGRR